MGIKVLREIKTFCPLLSSYGFRGVVFGGLREPDPSPSFILFLFAPILLGGASAAVLEA